MLALTSSGPEIPVEFICVNKKKMISNMEITYVNQKEITFVSTDERDLFRQVIKPIRAVESVNHSDSHELQELWGEDHWVLS